MIIKEVTHEAAKHKIPEATEPERYQVVLFNDETTTQEFVVFLLMKVFALSSKVAIDLMLQIHFAGRGIAGVYAYDVAFFKCDQARKLIQKSHYPLQIECQKVE
jgi:ATP-dependent Clp protease adaptor protein ClpS